MKGKEMQIKIHIGGAESLTLLCSESSEVRALLIEFNKILKRHNIESQENMKALILDHDKMTVQELYNNEREAS
jgi:hypothetical protein